MKPRVKQKQDLLSAETWPNGSLQVNGCKPGVACWCYRAVSSVWLLNTDSAVTPLSLASQGILRLYKLDGLIDWLNDPANPSICLIKQIRFPDTKISLKAPNLRMTPAVLASKWHRRYLERIWRSKPTALNRSRLTRQTHFCKGKVGSVFQDYCWAFWRSWVIMEGN